MIEPAKNYHASIYVPASQETCFQALATQMDKWWTQSVDGSLTKVGDKVTARFPPDYGYWTFEATSFQRPYRIEMACIDAHHKVEGQPEKIDQEWLGTKVVWSINKVGDNTEIRMVHDGLTPTLNCWEICLDGWNQFFKGSLKAFLNGNEPTPHSAA
ncbi:Activator of Hsp90 ATPase homolog 1-like protein [Poseidonocella pacifica]|uniref:Activator of Hsp90 ATPase homolog 1-like protein n=1 Tax=Poseidonocella pacifica TaxID=871651 RepID=A0A1I0X386_9RHOB|nr:SRPBCC domain-containing protein [Poseidonocella pacifica]SFA95445.1 Activator of Hsp90 ATPase homolog 1-like protein [Poseidonocella pacifica]